MGVAPRKIATGGPGIRCKECVADEGCISNNVSQASWSMSRRVKYTCLQVPNLKHIAFPEQSIKLATIARKICSGIESFAKHFLNYSDLFTNACFPAETFMEVGCSRQVISVHVGF